jgi:hypothetical protein
LPLALYIGDPAGYWAPAQRDQEIVKSSTISFRHHFHAAVTPIPHPTANAQISGLAYDEGAKPNALDVAFDDGFQASILIFRQISLLLVE